MTDGSRRPDPSPISDRPADASQTHRPPTDGQPNTETMRDTSSTEKDAPDNATTDHADHDSHDLVTFWLREVEDTTVEETCAWCDFETVTVGINKDQLHTLWLCDECATDIDMVSMHYGGQL